MVWGELRANRADRLTKYSKAIVQLSAGARISESGGVTSCAEHVGGQWRALSSGGTSGRMLMLIRTHGVDICARGRGKVPPAGSPPGKGTLLVRAIVYHHETIRLSSPFCLPASCCCSQQIFIMCRKRWGPKGTEPARKLAEERNCGVLKCSKDLWVFEVNNVDKVFELLEILMRIYSFKELSPERAFHHLLLTLVIFFFKKISSLI